jgi:hypothetical protein
MTAMQWSAARALHLAALGLVLAMPAWALDSPVTVTLSAPGGLTFDSTPILAVTVASTATGVTVGDGSAIGNGWMLAGEYVHFSGNSILIGVAPGAALSNGVLVTGYLGLGPVHASYEITGLNVPGSVITGFSGTQTGLNSPLSLAMVHLLSPSSLRIDLDTLVFTPTGPGQSDAFATLSIDLITAAVPEPAAWALWLAGGVAVLALRRRA